MHAEAGGDVAGELLLPAALHLRLDRHRLQRLDAGDALDQEGLVLRAAPELLVEPPAEQRRRPGRDRRCRTETPPSTIQRQQRRIEEHHREEDEGEEQVDHQRQRRAREEVADVLELAHARHRIADAPGLEIGDRQRQQMAEQPGAELDVDAVGGVGEQIGAQDAEDRLEDRDGDQADDQDVERAQAAMHEHLVDDDLEEQRRDQGKELQEERGDQHLAEQAAILVDGAQEPGDVEAARQVEQAGAARHQDEPAVPDRLELGPRHELGPRRQRMLDQRLVLADLAENQKAAVAQRGDPGQGRPGEPRPVRRMLRAP